MSGFGDEKEEEGRRGLCAVWKGFGQSIHRNAFSRLKVMSLALGQNHGLLLTIDYKLYSFGTGSALGTGVVAKNHCLPAPVADLSTKNVIQVACGPEHSAAVCDDGALFMWGENSSSQCGQPNDKSPILFPTQLRVQDHTHTCKLKDSVVCYRVRIQQVSCGKSHTLAVSKGGDLWAWGSLAGAVSSPHKVKSPALCGSRVLSICSGLHHNIAVVCPTSNEQMKCPTSAQVTESVDLSSGCNICDQIVSSRDFSQEDLVEERNYCPLGVSMTDENVEPTPSLPKTKRHVQDKRMKDLVNAAVGAGKEIELQPEGEIAGDVEVESDELVQGADANHFYENQSVFLKESRPEMVEIKVEKLESPVHAQSEVVKPSRLSITESFRQGVGYLSVQSVQSFLSSQFSSSSKSTESEFSSVPGVANDPKTLLQPNSTPLTMEARSSVTSPLDQFSFVFSDNVQSMEMSTYNLEAGDDLVSINRNSNSLTSLNIETRKSRGETTTNKVSSCERVNLIKEPSPTVVFDIHKETNGLNVAWPKCDVLSWGQGSEGQLGHGDSLHRDQPIRIRGLVNSQVVKVVSGHFHSLLLTACGRVYGWGSNSHGQLAMPSDEHFIISPQLIKIPDNAFVWDVGAGAKSSLFLINRFGEQQLYICGKREGQLDETNSIKAETLTVYNGIPENCKISQIYGGCPYFGCVMDQVESGLLGVLYELTNTELSFFSFLNKLATTALTPILQNEILINSCGSTVQQLLESFLEISSNSAKNGHRLRYIIQKSDRKESRPLFHDLEQQLALYVKYCKHYCDALAINGFAITVKTANSILKQASKVLMEMSNSVDVKIAMAPETLQHLMEEPIRRMNQYKKLFSNLAQQRKKKNWASYWELQAAEKWDRTIAWVAVQKQEAEKTRAFWDIYPAKVSDALKKSGRRVIRDSKIHSLSLLNSGRFSTHWFILFNDILAHYHFSGLEKYDISVIWVDPATGIEGKSNSFTLTLPEESIVLVCDSIADKTEWVSALNYAIDQKLKSKGNAVDLYSQPGSSRVSVLRCNPPLERHATYSFGKSPLYKDATYSGMWFCGQMRGHGELSWSDGRQYVGQFKQNTQDGFGTYIVDSCNGQTVYRGIWKNGKLNGLGSIKYGNGDTYEGYFKDRVRHGHGVLKCGQFLMSSASIYIGQWMNDKREGFGVLDDIERGEKYIGTWHDDLPHGKGILVTLDGIYFEGNFTKGQMGGVGLVYENDGCWYEGEVGPDHTFNGKGVLALAGGDSIEGHFTGYWNDDIKLSGTLTRSDKPKTILEMTFPKSFGTLSVSADEKWTDIFYHCYEMLRITSSDVSSEETFRKAWESIAIILSNWKKTHWKPSKSKLMHSCEDMSVLERIPVNDSSNFTYKKFLGIKDYLYKAFETPFHPLGRLMDGLVDVFRATYVGTGAHPCLHQHAVEEVHSYVNRINEVVRVIFPCLPTTGEVLAVTVEENAVVTEESDCDPTLEVITSEGLLLPVLLPKIHPPLFTLYALRHEKDDVIYWETLMKWNKQADLALMAFLGVDQRFWTSIADAGYMLDKRASMSTVRDCNYTKAIDTLQQLSTTFNPIEKLLVVQKAFEEINNEVQGKLSADYMWTMDDLFPVFQYVVVRAGIRHLGSEIHMMDDLMEKRFQNGELGIMFTMLRACYFQVKNERCLSL